MTLRNAEKITGLEIRPVDGPAPGRCLLAAFEGETEVARAAGRHEKDAAAALVAVIYQRRSRQAMSEQKWRCGQCWALRAMQCHHIHKRSHGRRDVRENFIALCAPCHEDIERRRVPLTPHPEILKAVAAYGLTWGGDQWRRNAS